MQKNLNPHTLLVGIENDAATLESSLAVPQMLTSYHMT